MPHLNRPGLYGLLLSSFLVAGCTGPMLALDCLSTSSRDHGTDFKEFDITLKMRDRNGLISEQKKHLLCHYGGSMCYASGAVQRWNTLSPLSELAVSTPSGPAVYYAPACDELAPGTLRYTDAFYIDKEAGQPGRAELTLGSLSYARPGLMGEEALATYGIQVVGIKVSAKLYDDQGQAREMPWSPILSWGTP